MKENKKKIFGLLVFLAVIVFVSNVSAEWCPASPLRPDHKPDITVDLLIPDYDQPNNWSESPSIVVFEDVPYITYVGQKTGSNWTRIFFTYWNGTKWNPPVMISSETETDKANNPILAIDIRNGEMHLVWSTDSSTGLKVYYSHSEGFGQPWSAPISLDELNSVTKNNAKFPFIALDSDGHPHTIFFYESGGTRKVYYTVNYGSGWKSPEIIGETANETGTGRINPIYITIDKKKVPNVPSKPIDMRLSALMQKIGVIKFEVVPDPCYGVCGNGVCENIAAGCNPGETASSCCGDCGTCAPDTIHILWKNKADEKLVHTQKDVGNSTTWSTPDQVDQQKSSHPFSVADNDAGLHVSYESKTIASNTEIYYKMLDSGNWNTKPAGGTPTQANISNSEKDSLYPSIAVDKDANPKIVWAETMPAPSNKKRIYYKEWDSESNAWKELGNPVWPENLSEIQDALYPNIRLNFQGNPYIAWGQKLGTSGKEQIWMVYWSDNCSSRPGPNAPPKAWCKANPIEGDFQTRFEFTAKYSSDDQTPTENLQVRWDWDDSDGVNYNTPWNTTKDISHYFKEYGQKTVTLQVKDNKGKVRTDTCQINVYYGDVLSLFDIRAEPISPKKGETINFSAFVLNQIEEDVKATLTFEITDKEGTVVKSFTPITQVIPKNVQGNPVEPIKEFIQSYAVDLPEYKIYYIYADVIVDPLDPLYSEHPETNKYLYNNNRRTVFTITQIRDVSLPETGITGIITAIIAVSYILIRKKKTNSF
ncbi:MAG: hypothetical protein COT90_00180 [Candidatus Diapherotrites archaeon CG10_big_fil_rev_8_21_14_0_10_31_34]|nr:MAG: hypothetical protein COT90_00180 [Candidatus Diapherotrites archaeon CG10_big_fil_rev_8_21_14_0_10_31_34]